MSRRKQSHPRHIESEHELAFLLENGISPSSSKNYGDAHVCGKCCAEFLELGEFLAHKKSCSRKIVVLYGREQLETECSRPQSPNIENLETESRLEPMDSGNMTTLDPSCKTRSPMMLNGEKELLQQEWNNGDYSLADDRYKTELVPHLPQYPLSFTQGLSNGNVVIEPMAGTKAAVAQFAENNLMPTDMALLHSTIYSLQQQQVLMMHILQQLQQQLVAFLSKGKVTQVPSGPPTLSPPIPVTSGAGAPQPIPAITDSSDRATRVATPANSAVVLSCTALPSTVPSITTSAPSSGILDNNDIHSTSMSSLTAHSLDYSRYRPGFLPRNPLVDLLAFHSPKNHHKPGSLERQPFGHQPFYKQKCKYCHKVFSSDNNFQLHMKSHAAKSPYRCNVCGIKFSSKGSLRLHFARHKPKVSHVKLHPHHPLPLPSHSASTHSTKNNTILPSSFTPVSSVSVSLPSRVITSPHISSTVSHASEQFIPASVPHPLAHVADRTSPAALVKQDNTSKPSSQMEPTSTSPVSAESVTPVASSAGILHLQPIVHLSSPKSSSPGIIQSPPIRNLSTTIATTLNSISLNASASGTFPILSPISVVPPLSSFAAFAPGASPSFTSPPVTSPPGALFPSKSIEPGENIEDYMEMTKSETSKLQQLVENIEQKLNDPNECVICHRVLSCKSALQMHYRIHTGERPFRCKICGRSFTTKGNLKTHMGVHRAKPPLRMMHQCPVCHKQFTNIIVLQQHIRMHTGEPLHSMTSSLYRGTDWHPKPYIPPHMDPHMEPRELDLSKSSGFPLSSASSFASSSPVCSPLETNKQSPLGLDAPPKLSAEKAENKLSDEQMETNDNKDEWDESKVHTDLSPQIENAPEQQERSNSAGSIISQESANSHKMDNIIPLSKYESQITSVITSSFVPPSSTSLAALEERVRAISSHTPLNMASTKYSFHHHSMSQHKPFSPPISHGGFSNGNRSPDDSSPRNLSSLESGSEANGIKEEIGSQTSTQPLSLHPESRGFPIGSVFPLAPALDLRPSSMEERLVTTCNICYKTFACRSALDIHYRSHTKERPYKCEVCDRSFSTRGNMKQHMLTHKIRDLPSKAFDENNDSSCDSDRQEDQRQIDPVSEQQPFKMESTNSIGGSQSPFVRRTSPKHLCSICQKHFSSQSALQIHIRTHTGDKPFKCNVCGKAFTTKGNLKVHMGTHMWNNSPSRRGRRMSIEPPFLVGPKDNPYLPPYSHRSPDVFFQYPHFLNGISPKMNEISVIQSLNGGVNHIPNNHHHHHHHHHHSNMGSTANNSIMDSSTPKEDSRNTTPSDGGRKSAENQPPSPLGSQSSDMNSYELMTTSGTGELDLSMKSTAPVIVSTSPVAVPSPQTDMAPEAHQNLSAWSWRTVCQICNQLFPSPPALEHHIRTQHSNQEETMHQMAIPN